MAVLGPNEVNMFRRKLLIPLVAAALVTSACNWDYWFLAYTIECPHNENGPTRCYPSKQWIVVRCTQFVSSGWELFAGNYNMELAFEAGTAVARDARAVGFPKKLQVRLNGTDAEGKNVFTFRPPVWKLSKATGKARAGVNVKKTVEITNDLVVPAGGTVCLSIKTKGRNQFLDGMLAGILWEELTATRVDP